MGWDRKEGRPGRRRSRACVATLLLLPLLAGCGGGGGSGGQALGSGSSAALSWAPPQSNADGTPLNDLAGYRLYWGTLSRKYDRVLDVGSVTEAEIRDDRVGTERLYFAVTAYDDFGQESVFSAEVVLAP